MQALGEDAYDGKLLHRREARTLVDHYKRLLAARRSSPSTAAPKADHAPEQRKETITSRSQRDRLKRVWAWLALITATLGGQAGFTSFVIDLICRATLGSHRGWGKFVVIDKDFWSQILDNAEIREVVERELRKKQTPRISRFRFAMIKAGVTIRGMDALRFAMSHCPGHEALATDKKAYLLHLDTHFCPGGAAIADSTARTDSEQAKDAEAHAEQQRAAAAEEEEAVEAEAEAAHAEGADDEPELPPATDAETHAQWAEANAQDTSGEFEGHEEAADETEAPDRRKGSYGAKCLVDALTMLLVGMWWMNVVLPGSSSQSFGFKLTCDAAFLRNAPKWARNVTTVMVSIVCAGVKGGNWGARAVRHMVRLPQSALRAFKLRVWYGKDNRENVRAATQTRPCARAASSHTQRRRSSTKGSWAT